MPTVAIPITPDIATLILPDGTEVDVRLGFGLSLSVDAVRPPTPPPPSGPSVRGTAQTGVNTATVVLPTNVAGDVMLVWAISASNRSIPGWTQIINQPDGAGGSYRLLVFTKVSAGGEATATISGTVGGWAAVSVQGATAVDVVGSVGGFDVSAPFTFTCADVTPTVAPTLLLDAVAAIGVGPTPIVTMPTGEVEVAAVGTPGFAPGALKVGSLSLSSTGPTGTRTGSADAGNVWATGTTVIK